MAQNGFMEASINIGEMISKKKQVLNKIGGYIAKAVISRASSGVISDQTEKDITNLINDLPDEDKVTVLLNAISSIANSGSINKSNEKQYNQNYQNEKKKQKRRNYDDDIDDDYDDDFPHNNFGKWSI